MKIQIYFRRHATVCPPVENFKFSIFNLGLPYSLYSLHLVFSRHISTTSKMTQSFHYIMACKVPFIDT